MSSSSHHIYAQNLKSITDEFRELCRLKLYTQQEATRLLPKHKQLLNKITAAASTATSTTSLQDYKDLIRHTLYFLRDVKERRQRSGCEANKSNTDLKIIERIHDYYRRALMRFPLKNNLPFYLEYFRFCKNTNRSSAAVSYIQYMQETTPKEPEIWRIASIWYSQYQNDTNRAVVVLQHGLDQHRTSKILYKEMIKLKLSMPMLPAANSNSLDPERYYYNQIETHVKSYCEHNVSSFTDLFELLVFVETYKFTKLIQNMLVDQLQQHHSDKELLWHYLAQKFIVKGPLSGSNGKWPNRHQALSQCFAKYQEGLKNVSEPRAKSKLYRYYLDCLLKYSSQIDGDNNDNKMIIDLLKTALEEASRQDNCLTETYFLKWLDLVSSSNNDYQATMDILEKGTKAVPHSIDLWKLRLQFATMSQSISEVESIFSAAIESLKDKEGALPLWLAYLDYSSLIYTPDQLKSIYKWGLSGNGASVVAVDVLHVLKTKYLQWLALFEGIDSARAFYQSNAQVRPFCKELHDTMAKLESTEIDCNLTSWGRVYRLTCEQFGEDDIDVWINYMLFHVQYDKNMDKVVDIYREAETRLSSVLVSDFKQKCSKYITLSREIMYNR